MDYSGTTILTPWHPIDNIIYLMPPVEGDLWRINRRNLRVLCPGALRDCCERLLSAVDIVDAEIVTTDNESLATLVGMALNRDCIVVGTAGSNALLEEMIRTDARLQFSPTHGGEMLIRTVDRAFQGSEDAVVLAGVRNYEVEIAAMALATAWRSQPIVAVVPDIEIDFGRVEVNTSRVMATYTLSNVGAGTLNVQASAASPFGVVGYTSYRIEAGQTEVVSIAFTPALHNSAPQAAERTALRMSASC